MVFLLNKNPISNNNPFKSEVPNKIEIYHYADYENHVVHFFIDPLSLNEAAEPLLIITENDGLVLFANMIKNAKRMSGALSILKPEYVAFVYFNDNAEILDLYFSNTSNDNTSKGLFINKKDTHTGYYFRQKDEQAFIEMFMGDIL